MTGLKSHSLMMGQVTQFSLPYLGETGRTPVLGSNPLPPSCAKNLVPKLKARGSRKYTGDTAMEMWSGWARKSQDAAGRRGFCRSRPWRHLAASPCTCICGLPPPAQRPGLSPEPPPACLSFPGPRSRRICSREAQAQSRLSADSTRGDPGPHVYSKGLGALSGTRGYRPSDLLDALPGRLPMTKKDSAFGKSKLGYGEGAQKTG